MAAFAAQTGDTRLAPVLRRLNRPIGVRIAGRPGTGRATVTAALRAAGATVTAGPAEVTVLVVAETIKPEDVADGADAALIVLNKRDLLGPAAPRQRAEIARRTGRPTVSMNALLATAVLDDALVGALQAMAAHPPDLSSTDAVAAGPHVVDASTRARLLATLDRFGIGRVAAALRTGVGPGALPALLRELSGVDEVLAGLAAATAPVRYRRVETALTEVRALAAQSGTDALWDLLACDAVVLAVMSAAADVLRADGLPAGSVDAVRWSRYGRGPLNNLHRSCARALVRGSLRLAART